MIGNYSDLKGKKVLITGASRGIGKSIALNLAQQGAHVIFNYRQDLEKAQILKKELETQGGQASALNFDITQYEQMNTAISDFIKEHGAIEGLVNNAGISKDQLLLRLKPEDITQILDTNLKGAMVLTSQLTRFFLKAENVSIVNLSSIVGLMGNPAQSAYAASKAGLIGFTKSCAKELASRNIRCNAICPGFIQTEMTSALDEKLQQKYKEAIPLGKFGTTDDVASLTCFLLSRASSYMTGTVIKIDGGLYI